MYSSSYWSEVACQEFLISVLISSKFENVIIFLFRTVSLLTHHKINQPFKFTLVYIVITVSHLNLVITAWKVWSSNNTFTCDVLLYQLHLLCQMVLFRPFPHLYILFFRRLDYFVISHGLMEHVCDHVIRSQVYGSDHCPIVLLITL